MATTIFFEENLQNAGGSARELQLEVGTTNFIRENSIYITVDGKQIVMDEKMSKKFVEAVGKIGRYYGFNK